MNTDEQRIAIAEACGWKRRADLDYLHDGEWRNVWERDGYHAHNWPDYLNDLNAMHEAEKVLTVTQSFKYSQELGRVAGQDMEGCTRAENDWVLCHATAAQRAEVFLKAIGKWQD